MKIIGRQGMSRYLVLTKGSVERRDGVGFVIDTQTETRSPAVSVFRILKAGYWQPYSPTATTADELLLFLTTAGPG